MNSQISHKQRREFSNESVNSVNEPLNGPDNWFGVEDARLVERYVKCDFRLIFCAPIAEEEWLTYFQRFPETRCSEPRSLSSEVVSPIPCVEMKLNLSHAADSHEQAVMLVGNVQFVEHPKIVSLPVFVGFGPLDFTLGRLRHSLDSSSKRVFINFGALKDRKTGLIRDGLVLSEHELTGQMIQSASQVVNGIPCVGTNVVWDRIDLAHKKEVEILIAGFRMWLGANDIRFTVDKPIPSHFQILEMSLCPFDFHSNEGESFVGCKH